MIDIYMIANWFTGCFEAYCWYLLFECFLHRRRKFSKWVYYGLTAGAALLINVSNAVFSIGVLNLVLVFFIGVATSFSYEGKFKFRILTAALGVMISTVAEVITLVALSMIFNKQANVLIANNHFRLIGIAISKMLGYAVTKCIVYRVKKRLKSINISYWLLFFLMFLSSTLTICTFCRVLENGASGAVRNMIYVCTFGVTVTTIFILYIYEKTLKQQNTIMEQQLSQMQMKNQVEHYDALIMSQEQVRKTKHDLRNHLFGIRAMIEQGEYTKAKEYIDTLANPLGGTDKIYYNTGNNVLDAILTSKRGEAEKKGIAFQTNLMIPADLPIEPADICCIFGNALDNAIEACEKVSDQPYISVTLKYGENTLICGIENTYAPAFDIKKATTKDDIHNHGIGRMNMKRALEHYNSAVDIKTENNIYTLTFMLMNLK